MCGRVYVKSSLAGLMQAFASAGPGDAEGMANEFPRWNGAPRQDYPIIIQEPDVRGPVFMRARWGLIPRKTTDPKGGPQPISARSETIATNGLFKFAYRYRRALMPINGFFEWKDVRGTGKDKQPYAIAMKDGSPFALGHPLGMSGARIAGTAALELRERKARLTLATMCIGVGQGIAVALERA
jgi:putative SOS response-associated peptidase YedK